MYRSSPLRHLTTVLACVGLSALALGACSAGSTPNAADPSSPSDCLHSAPQSVDGAAAQKNPPKTLLLIVNAVPGAQLAQVQRDAGQVLSAASLQGMSVIVTGPGMPPAAQLPLRGAGANPTERHQNRCQILQTEIAAVASALTGRATAQPAIFAPLKTASDTLVSAGSANPDEVLVLGSASNAAGSPLTGEALDHPQQFIEHLGQSGLLRRCDGTRFGFFVSEAAGSDQDAVGYREFWRQYARACGGRLVAWSDTVTSLGTTELPPTPAVTASAPPAPPTPSPTPTSGKGPTVYTLQATTLFAIDSAVLTPAAVNGMRAMLDAARTATSVTVRGYTDDLKVPGDPDSSTRLSRARADAVAVVLRGVVPAGVQVTPIGMGAADPVASNTPALRYLNRRVAVTIEHHRP